MELIFILLQIPATLMVLYLTVLSCAAALWHGKPAPAPPRNRFAFLIPAHNEETFLPRLLQSIESVDYPHHLYDVHVVADNCVDATAARAAEQGAKVHERRDNQLRGKGYAVRWLLSRIQTFKVGYHAYIIVDADSVVSTDFLAVMNRHLIRGDRAVQSYYGVLNHQESWSSGLRYAALVLFNNLRPRGRDALGLSAGLRGNGMCFTSAVIEKFGWDAFTLAEDAEFHLHLVQADIKVRYAAEATVLAEMPTSLRAAHTQNVRWERGRLQLVRKFGPPLLTQGILRRDLARLDALAEQLVPPLSVLTAITTVTFVIAALVRMPRPLWLASLVLLGQMGYVATGLQLVRAGSRIYLSFLAAPLYIVWKLWIYTVAAVHLHDNRWIRTARSSQDIGSG